MCDCNSEYIDTLMDQSPEAVLLIARLSPTGTPPLILGKRCATGMQAMLLPKSSSSGRLVTTLLAFCSPLPDETLLPPGQDTRLIGTVSLSMTPKTREEFQTLQPAADKCYLSNMAVDAKFRRWHPFSICHAVLPFGVCTSAPIWLPQSTPLQL